MTYKFRSHLSDNSDVWTILGIVIGVFALAALALWFQTWLLGIVLGWFGLSFGFWKCFVIVLLLNSFFGVSRKS